MPDGITAIENVPYASDTQRGHLLDIYYPNNVMDDTLPVFIDIHGGGFMSGWKELNRLFGYHMARRGFLVFNLNYRHAYFETTVLGQIQDVSMAVRWIFENLHEFHGDKERVFLCGHSAGGVLALSEALSSMSPRLQELFDTQNETQKSFKGIVIDCGLMTFYQKNIRYWGMRRMCFEKNYPDKEYYQNMIWGNLPELSQLPPVFLISNEKDELRQMTFDFQRILEPHTIKHKFDYRTEKLLGHMAIIYEPDSVEGRLLLDEMTAYLLA